MSNSVTIWRNVNIAPFFAFDYWPLSKAKKGAMFTLRHIVTECDMIHAIFLDFLVGLIFFNATFKTCLPFQMSVLKRLENGNFS